MTLQEQQANLIKPSLINYEEIDDNFEFNCRGKITVADVEGLAQDISKNGLLQPIIVRPLENGKFKYRLVAGFSRFKALRMLNWKIIPCVIRQCNDEEASFINLSENIIRKDLNFMQEAYAIRNILLKYPRLNPQEVGEKLGQTRRWVTYRLYAISLPDEVKDYIGRGYLTLDQIKAIYEMDSEEKRLIALRKIKNARERGLRAVKLFEKKPYNPMLKEPRTKSEIYAMQDHIVASLKTNNFGTRCLAWAAGTIEDLELFGDIANIADNEGLNYIIPTKLEMKTREEKYRGE